MKQLDDLMETEEKYPVMTLLGDLLQTDQKPLKISKKDNKPKMVNFFILNVKIGMNIKL